MTRDLDHRAVLELTTRRLERASVPAAAHDALTLLAHTLGRRRADVILDDRAVLSRDAAQRLESLVERRVRREPLQHLVGWVGFHDVLLAVDRRALVPRPETECLVTAVLEWIGRRRPTRPRILDLGTGTGAIAIAIASALPSSRIVATDLSPDAAALARANAERSGTSHAVAVVVGDWLQPFRSDAVFDVVVSNPPYVTTGEIGTLAPEVREYDPRLALDGGHDGLQPYRAVCTSAASHIDVGGLLAFEVATERADAVAAIVDGAGFRDVVVRGDLDGRPRIVLGER